MEKDIKGEIPMNPKIEGPYKKKTDWKALADIFRVYIIIGQLIAFFALIIIQVLIIFHVADIRAAQLGLDKTLHDAMDQLMEVRLEIDEYKDSTSKEIEELTNHVKRNTYPFTLEERELIESMVMREAGGESYEGQLAVAQVIRDRSELWAKSVKEVCLAPGQFAEPSTAKAHILAKHAVWEVFYHGTRIIPEPVTHFHAQYANPKWTATKVSRGEYGRQKFYF